MKEIVEPIEHYALDKTLTQTKKTLFSKIGIVGCGEVGRNLAITIAKRGMEIYFVDVNDEKVKYAYQKLEEHLDTLINRWGMTEGEKRAVLSRIHGSAECKSLKGCDLVIEAVRSKNREKSVAFRKEIFKRIEQFVDTDTIIATNSTTIVITELASELQYPHRCVSMHIFTSISDVSVFEVVTGLHRDEKTLKHLQIFAKLLGKKMILVEESPGLISIRVVALMINEACKILIEGVGSMQDIDTMMRQGLNFPLGPFGMADKVGIDKVLRWLDNMYNEFGDPIYKASPIIKRLARAGYIGRKTKRGFYEYDEKGKPINYFDLSTYKPLTTE